MMAGTSLAQADNLGIPQAQVLPTLAKAAEQLSLDFSPGRGECLPFRCSWEMGHAVRLSAAVMDGTSTYQLEVAWNNGDKASTPTSFQRFRDICLVVVATAYRGAEKPEMERIAQKISTFEGNGGRAMQPEERTAKVVFYGTKSRPVAPAKNGEAFFQCGAIANTSGSLN
ncbi:hypothetical protein [Rhizobium sp. Root149]|uniref:hypothetical protein n=1 Tax=Rhizobium sp. Root149 TaxID=1736473 RepID=UPI0012E39050|nr:hypothetical protein [Rhizobium sp. Root149]